MSRVPDVQLPRLVMDDQSTKAPKKVFMPGDVITLPGVDMSKCIQGKGLRRDANGAFIAQQLGTVEKVNQMLLIQSTGGKYRSTVGDLIVGRVVDVNYTNASWGVNIKGFRTAQLPLAAVVLPCGTQRRRNEQDQLNMRELFDVNDVIIAEVQRVGRDNASTALHTRSVRFGQLHNGVLIEVAPCLISRSDRHMAVISLGNEETKHVKTTTCEEAMTVEGNSVFVVLGLNGNIWVGAPQPAGEQDGVNYAENAAEYRKVELKLRSRIARVRAAVMVLADHNLSISWSSLENVIEASCGGNGLNLSVSEMYLPEKRHELLNLVHSGQE